MTGPLQGVKIIEFAGIGPGPFCGMMLGDHGAEVISIDRIGARALPVDALRRSKKSVAINLKSNEGAELARALCKEADGLIEGFRPGVMERMGLGPDVILKDNPKLVYGRMTGWGQSGPYAPYAGHDINYISLSGALHTCGREGGKPTPPVNYLGDFGGGAMMLAFGMLSAMIAVKNGAHGQVIDCAMTDGSAMLTAMTWSLQGSKLWKDARGVNALDTGAHYYDTYETKDGKWISIGSIEPQFYAVLRQKAGLANEAAFDAQNDPAHWPVLKEKLAALFKTKTRAQWCAIMEESDVCFAPVLSLEEAPRHPHNQARGTFVEIDGAVQPAPAPRYSDTSCDTPKGAAPVGIDTDAVLSSIGCDKAKIEKLRLDGVID